MTCQDALSSIPPELAAATWLRHHVLMNFNQTIRLDPAGLDSLVGLTALELLECKLAAPPPQLSSLTALCRLRLSYNYGLGASVHVAAAASWGLLSALQRLSSLSLASCGLCELPAVLSQFGALKAGACFCFFEELLGQGRGLWGLVQ